MGKRRSHNRGENNPASKLTEKQVREILVLLSRDELQEVIAEKYDISRSLVSMIKHRRIWKDVSHD